MIVYFVPGKIHVAFASHKTYQTSTTGTVEDKYGKAMARDEGDKIDRRDIVKTRLSAAEFGLSPLRVLYTPQAVCEMYAT